jgi:NADPH:quinone reductase-like Zn-dependent oxidoreductase
MKAVKMHTYGGALALEDVPLPTIGDEEMLVKIRCTAVNHLDLVEASGAAKQMFPINLPWTPGHEFSGVVERVGKAVVGFAPGDAVFGDSSDGAYAEYLAAKQATVAKKPSNLSFEEAASVPVAAQTAWQAVFTHGRLTKGQTILIHGGAGGVGAYAVQFAANAGANVIATASADDEAYVKSLGATRVIDYETVRFEDELTDKVDVVFDLVGGETQERSFDVLKRGGYLVAANQPVSQEEAAKYGVTGILMNMTPTAALLGQLSKLLEEGKIVPDVAKVYALSDVARAWTDMAGGAPGQAQPDVVHTHGKLVLQVS